MALDNLPEKLPINKPTSVDIKTPGELSIPKSQADKIKKAREGDYGLDFKQYNQKKKEETKRAREKLKEDRKNAKLASEDRKKALQQSQETIQNNTPDDQKPDSTGKFNAIVNSQTTKLITLILPNLVGLAQSYISNNDICPSPEITKNVLNQFNGIVEDLNKTADSIDKVAVISGAVSTTANTIQQVSTVLKTTIPIVSAAAKLSPIIPGVVVSALDDLDWLNNNLLYKNDGSAKLPPIIAGVNALTLSVSLFSLNLRNAIGIITPIILKLQRCLPEGETSLIQEPSPTALKYADYGRSNYENYNESSYKGFIIKIEEVPYTSTVIRKKAVGYTTNGVPLIQTELSFTANPQTLVAELKLIIDRDNLKAY